MTTTPEPATQQPSTVPPASPVPLSKVTDERSGAPASPTDPAASSEDVAVETERRRLESGEESAT